MFYWYFIRFTVIITSVYGDWRSWLARRVWDAEVGGSSPLSPTMYVIDFKAEVILHNSTNTAQNNCL
jgi:hypothetical protein